MREAISSLQPSVGSVITSRLNKLADARSGARRAWTRRMPYGRQAVAKPLVTRRARPNGEDAKTFEEVCANDPPTAAAIRAALIQRQNTPAAFVGGSPSKRTMDALAAALAEDPNREDDASGAL